MRRKLLGNEHPDVADSLNGLANVLHAQGKLAEAETMARGAGDAGNSGHEHRRAAHDHNLAGVLEVKEAADAANSGRGQLAQQAGRRARANKLTEAETVQREALMRNCWAGSVPLAQQHPSCSIVKKAGRCRDHAA